MTVVESVLYEETVSDDGPLKLIEKCGLIDVVSLEDDRPALDLITEIDAKRARRGIQRFEQHRQRVPSNEVRHLRHRPIGAEGMQPRD